MTVELLHFDGCPNHEALLPQLERLLRSAQVSAKIEPRRIPDDDAAQRERFLGSPTVRVDGRDVEPGADDRDDFGLKCRLYQLPTRLRGTPPDAWVLDAIARSNDDRGTVNPDRTGDRWKPSRPAASPRSS